MADPRTMAADRLQDPPAVPSSRSPASSGSPNQPLLPGVTTTTSSSGAGGNLAGLGALHGLITHSMQTALNPMAAVFQSIDASLRGVQSTLQQLQPSPGGTPPRTNGANVGQLPTAAAIQPPPNPPGTPACPSTSNTIATLPAHTPTRRVEGGASLPPAGSLAGMPLITASAQAQQSISSSGPSTATPLAPPLTYPYQPTLASTILPPVPLNRGTETQAITVGPNALPISPKLAQKILKGEFVEMVELLPESMGQDEEKDKESTHEGPKRKKRRISNALQWTECFNAYITVVATREPSRVPDLLAYASLIVRASRMYQGDGWAHYDRTFRKKAAAFPGKSWREVDGSLWTMAFCHAKPRDHCEHCFSIDHATSACEEEKDREAKPSRKDTFPAYTSKSDQKPACRLWNRGACTARACSYRHVCLLCNRPHVMRECPGFWRYTPYPNRHDPPGYDKSDSFRKKGAPSRS